MILFSKLILLLPVESISLIESGIKLFKFGRFLEDSTFLSDLFGSIKLEIDIFLFF